MKTIFRRVPVVALLVIATLSAPRIACADAVVLSLHFGDRSVRVSRAELLARADVRLIDVPGDAAYRRPMRYRAIPLAALIPKPRSASVQFTATDGFVANIPSGLLYGAAQPWLAVELADRSWPPLGRDGVSAGPFYLVWLKPEKAGISPEQWPYRIAGIGEAAALEKRFPALLPKTTAGTPAQRGLRVFVANCSVCHKLGGAGDAAVGPDLNAPYNPTEYFQARFLRQLIRQSASVRNWNGRAMPGFSASALPDAQLDDLLAYLRQMARQRHAQPLP